jgi:lipoprotein-anchoring transpeptidase ErfK/SrfK
MERFRADSVGHAHLIAPLRCITGPAMTKLTKRFKPTTPGVFLAVAVFISSSLYAGEASAQFLSFASPTQSAFPEDSMTGLADPQSDEGSASVVPDRLRRAIVAYDTREAPGTLIVDTGNTTLYYVLGQGRAIRYGVGVGREGFTWSGVQTVTRKMEWPDWHPPAEMVARQPYLPRFMAGGPGNPLGARAMYLGSSVYRIHGTNDPSTIGKFVSSGCIRLTNEDVIDLFNRVNIGSKVVVLPKSAPRFEVRSLAPRLSAAPSRPDRQAMNLSGSSVY